MIKCKDCCYFYANTDDKGNPIENPHCHYQYNDGYAPCEAEETEAYYNEEQ